MALGNKPPNSVYIPQSLVLRDVLRSIVLGYILVLIVISPSFREKKSKTSEGVPFFIFFFSVVNVSFDSPTKRVFMESNPTLFEI